jgi:AcrR family transcriptional regulator
VKQSDRTVEPRTPLSRERVFQAAVALADERGIEAMTMRAVGEELGVEAMSLYYYVANKDELLDGMVDVVFSEIELPATDVDWKTAVRRRAISTREALGRHPWAVGLMESRTRPGPANFRLHDAVLGCLRAAGFSVANAVHAYSVQDAYIYGFALQEKSMPVETPEQLTEAAESMRRQFSNEYPHLAETISELVTKPGYHFADEFEVGLDLILDGLERLRDTPDAKQERSRRSEIPPTHM